MNEKLKYFNVLEHNDKVALFSLKYKTYLVTTKDFYKKSISMPEKKNALLKAIEKQIDISSKTHSLKEGVNTIYYIMTRKCNLNCSFCALRANKNVSLDYELNIKEIEKYVVPKIKKLNPRKIMLTGGEPLTLKNLKDITKCFRENLNSKITLQTNGTLINNEFINILKDNLNEIDISTGHMFLNKDTYKKMCENIELVKQNNLKLLLTFIIDKENNKHIKEVIDLAVKYDSNLLLNFVSHVGNALDNNLSSLSGKEKVDIYYEIVNHIIDKKYYNEKVSHILDIMLEIKQSCGACGDMLAILPEGKIFMCHSLTEDNFFCGDIRKNSSTSIKSNLNQLSTNSDILKYFQVDYIEQCTNCEFKYLCQGSCAAERYWNPSKPIDCDLNKLMITYSLFYYNSKNSTEVNLKNFKKLIENEIYTEKTNKLCLN